jgi:hypothetical protein
MFRIAWAENREVGTDAQIHRILSDVGEKKELLDDPRVAEKLRDGYMRPILDTRPR